MRKYLLAILLLLIPIAAYSWMGTIMVGGGTQAAAGAECPWSGDEDFGWTGELADGDLYGCVEAVSSVGTESGAGIVSADDNHTTDGSNAIDIDADNEYLMFTKTHGYAYFRMVAWIKSTIDGYTPIFTAYKDDNNVFWARIENAGQISLYHKSNGTLVYFAGNTNDAIATGTWTKFEILIQDGGNICGGSEEMGLRIDYNLDGDFGDANEGWECEADEDNLVAISSPPEDYKFGVLAGYEATTSKTIYIDDVQIWWAE